MKYAVMLFMTILFASPLVAQVKGTEDPAFQEAVDLWLTGDDANALYAMADLARTDVPAAQVFLGQIENRTWLHAHVTRQMERKERIALMRNPQGLSGRSWLLEAAETTPHVRLLLDSKGPVDGIALGQALATAGETQLALDHIMRFANASGDWVGAVQLALHPDLTMYTSGFVQTTIRHFPSYAEAGTVDLNDPRLADISAGLGAMQSDDTAGELMWLWSGDVQSILDDPVQLRTAGSFLINDPRVAPITDLIRDACGDDAATAIAAIQFSKAGEPIFDLMFSPVPTAISNERYVTSARFVDDMKRQLSFVRQRRELIERLSPCAHTFVTGGQ